VSRETLIAKTVLQYYPDAQAIYLFGSYGTEDEWAESDVDVAVLLPPDESKKRGSMAMSDLALVLQSLLKKDVDLINLRRVSTVLQKEVAAADRRIYTGDPYAADEFEMLALSNYQKLNEERSGIIASALADGRFHQV
jgi:predicted nucleotidyltransferase